MTRRRDPTRRQINVRLPRRQIDAIDTEATTRGVSRAYIIERALDDWITLHHGAPVIPDDEPLLRWPT